MSKRSVSEGKRGRKGGARFPRIALEKALAYTKKLVEVTAEGPKPKEVVFPEVFGVKGPSGNERVSALRQFGLAEGDPKGYQATELGKKVARARGKKRGELLQQAFFSSELYKNMYGSLSGKSCTASDVESAAKTFKVHPDNAAECAKNFIASALFAGLGSMDGDKMVLADGAVTAAPEPAEAKKPAKRGRPAKKDQAKSPATNGRRGRKPAAKTAEAEGTKKRGRKPGSGKAQTGTAAAEEPANARIQINIDPSMDPRKLARLLKVLREYGQI